MDEVQIHLNVLAFDGENDPDILAGIAASAAIAISDIPFITPDRARARRPDRWRVRAQPDRRAARIQRLRPGRRRHEALREHDRARRPRGRTKTLVADAIEFGHKARHRDHRR